MAMLKYGTASLAEPGISVDTWTDKVYKNACEGGKCRMKTAKSVIAKYDPKKYLLSHCSIIAAVDTELANPDDPKTDYYIHPAYSKFINNNGDAWSKKMLETCYRSFIGCNNYCFPAGTRILMADGTYRPIETIKEGDRVINRKGEVGTVTQTYVRSADRLIELSGRGILSRKLMTTPEHPLWLYNARKTCPKTGRPNFFDKDKDFHKLSSWVGFSVGVHKTEDETYPVGITPDWVEAQKVDPKRNFFSHPVSSVEIENSEINSNRSELIGWFLAEGSYQTLNKFTPGEESGVVFNLGNDESDVAERLATLIIEEFGENFRVDCKPRIYETESGSYCMSVSNKVVADFFNKWCGKYSWAKRLPEEAMLLPKNLQAIILKNCINGDGSGAVASRGYSLEMKSRDLIQQLLFISWRLGLLPTYKETGVLGRYSVLTMVDGFEVYIDPNTGKKSRPGYMLRFSTRDSKSLNKFLNVQDERIASRESNRVTNIFGDESGQWLLSKIDSQCSIDVSCEVYNIEVDKDNSYIAEGVAVHNCEHVQIPELSKGKVIDAAMREIPIGKDDKGNDLTTYYVDILVATDRKHKDLVRKIEARELDTLSMGCVISYSICSKCGKKAVDESEACQHVRYQKNNTFYDRNGVMRKVAELCGHHTEPDSVKFVDASWVKQPAFTGAVVRSFVAPSAEIMAKLDEAHSKESYIPKSGDYLKAAGHLIVAQPEEEEPAGDEPAAETPEEAPEGEEPTEEVPAEEPAAETPEEAPEGEPAEAPAEEEDVEFDQNDVRRWKTKIKKRLLEELGEDVIKSLEEEEKEPEVRELETFNDSLVKPASSAFSWVYGAKKAFDKLIKKSAKNLDKKQYDKLRHGAHMLLTSSDMTVLADYGYNKRDVLAVLSFLDGQFKKPLALPVKKAIAKIGGTRGEDVVTLLGRVVDDIGRKVTRKEAETALAWLRLLDSYND